MTGRTQAEAARDRSKGRTFAMKSFHNTCKRDLIAFHVQRCGGGGGFILPAFRNGHRRESMQAMAEKQRCTHHHRHLDLACGRGGDLDKWFDAGITTVLGLDVSPNEIDFATRRCTALKVVASPQRRHH